MCGPSGSGATFRSTCSRRSSMSPERIAFQAVWTSQASHACRVSEPPQPQPSGISRSVDRLTKLGLLERVPNPDDRRSFVAGLTREGLGRLREAQVTHHRVVRETLCAHLDAPDLKLSASPGKRPCQERSRARPGRCDHPAGALTGRQRSSSSAARAWSASLRATRRHALEPDLVVRTGYSDGMLVVWPTSIRWPSGSRR